MKLMTIYGAEVGYIQPHLQEIRMQRWIRYRIPFLMVVSNR